MDDGAEITIGGIVTGLRQIYTRNNDAMAFVQLETLDSDVEVVVFPRVWEKSKDQLAVDSVVLITGKINAKDREGKLVDELKILADSVKPTVAETARMFPPPEQTIEGAPAQEDLPNENIESITISLQSTTEGEKLLHIKRHLEAHKGSVPIMLHFAATAQNLRLPGGIDGSESLIAGLIEIVGESNVVIKKKPTPVSS